MTQMPLAVDPSCDNMCCIKTIAILPQQGLSGKIGANHSGSGGAEQRQQVRSPQHRQPFERQVGFHQRPSRHALTPPGSDREASIRLW